MFNVVRTVHSRFKMENKFEWPGGDISFDAVLTLFRHDSSPIDIDKDSYKVIKKSYRHHDLIFLKIMKFEISIPPRLPYKIDQLCGILVLLYVHLL